jgi:uncharacterized protein (DUF1684 family)
MMQLSWRAWVEERSKEARGRSSCCS